MIAINVTLNQYLAWLTVDDLIDTPWYPPKRYHFAACYNCEEALDIDGNCPIYGCPCLYGQVGIDQD